MRIRAFLARIKLIRTLASVKLAVFCLLLFFILTLGGTIAQVQDGLYLAQERYFHSFFFLLFKFIPFPGAQLVMWVFFFNLIAVALIRLNYRWRNAGIIVIHFGLLLFLVSGYVLLNCSEESYIALKEGQSTNVSRAYHDWELSIWPVADPSSKNTVLAVEAQDSNNFQSMDALKFSDDQIQVTVVDYYKNAEAYVDHQSKFLNATGIGRLKPVEWDISPEKNTPGGVFDIATAQGDKYTLMLYGGETKPTYFSVGEKKYAAMLRFKRYPLPFEIKLIDFKMEKHPGTDMARRFQSLVKLKVHNSEREKLISMNEPLRYKDYTLYQSSYSISKSGQETSIFATVKNQGRYLPYISTFVTFFGLVIHFIVMALTARKPKVSPFTKEDE